jgi:hypothetical protein
MHPISYQEKKKEKRKRKRKKSTAINEGNPLINGIRSPPIEGSIGNSPIGDLDRSI